MRRGAAAAVALAALLGSRAEAREEPFGQETVEVRPFRQAPSARGVAHGHKGHTHKHAQGRAGAHRGHAHVGYVGAGHARHSHAQAHAHGHADRAGAAHDHGIETEHLFGFTTGTDIGAPGHRHAIVANDVAFGKRGGTYIAGSHVVEYAFTPWKDFHIGVSGGFASHAIADVAGFDDRRQVGFDHVAIEFRQRLLDRKTSPFGLTVVVEPHRGRIDDASGERVDKTAVDVTLAADKELIADRLFVAFNAFYATEQARSLATREVERASVAGVSFAAMSRVLPKLFAGAELRYARAYGGLALERFAGEALFLGPTLYAAVAPSVALVAAWSAQVSGRAVGAAGPLDLDNFERHRARLKLVVGF